MTLCFQISQSSGSFEMTVETLQVVFCVSFFLPLLGMSQIKSIVFALLNCKIPFYISFSIDESFVYAQEKQKI